METPVPTQSIPFPPVTKHAILKSMFTPPASRNGQDPKLLDHICINEQTDT